MIDTQMDELLDEMEVAGSRERAILAAAISGTDIQIMDEGLSVQDLQLIDALVKRFDKMIKGGLLLSFMALRQQIKALQKEIADMRKQTDRNMRKFEAMGRNIEKLVHELDESKEKKRKTAKNSTK